MERASLLQQLTTDAERDGVQQFVVGAVVQHGGRVLLLRRSADDFMGGIFELPSGKVEPGEVLDVALIREVKEETGLNPVAVRDFLGSFDYTSSSGRKSRQFNFIVDVTAHEPIKLQEHDAYKWIPIAEEMPVTDAVKGVLGKYQELRGV